MPLSECEVCGASFVVAASRLRRGKGRYCSRACQTEARRLPKNQICAYCSGDLIPRRKETRYCSRRCAALALHNDSQTLRTCKRCNTSFASSSVHNVFCSGACEARHAAASGKLRIMHDPWLADFAHNEDDMAPPRRPDFTLGF